MNRTHCSDGHVLLGDNVLVVRLGPRQYRTCRMCYRKKRNARYKERYRTDPVFRERELAKASKAREKRKLAEGK